VDDVFEFRALVLDVENILADAIVTRVCCIGPQWAHWVLQFALKNG
jgi:hypothetical protein